MEMLIVKKLADLTLENVSDFIPTEIGGIGAFHLR